MPSPGAAQAEAERSLRVVGAARLSREELAALVRAHHRAVAAGEGVLKDGRRSRVTRVVSRGEAYCVKEYRAGGWLDRITESLYGRRARRAWRSAALFTRCGIRTPEPVALVEGRATSYLVTRFIEGAVPLDRLLRERFAGVLGAGELAAKRALVRQLAWWLRGVHDLGVYHDDWSTKNILTVRRGDDWEFHFLDLESVVPRKRRLTYRRRVKNLGQLSDAPFGIARTDRMRFLVAYAGGDRALTRGRFPQDIVAAARRRGEAWARVQAKARKQRERKLRNA